MFVQCVSDFNSQDLGIDRNNVNLIRDFLLKRLVLEVMGVCRYHPFSSITFKRRKITS